MVVVNNSFKICYGKYSRGTNTIQTITLPMSFDSIFSFVALDSTYKAEHGHIGVTAQTNSTVTIGGTGHTSICYYISIGY